MTAETGTVAPRTAGARAEREILEAVRALLEEVGPAGTTVEAIAKRAGVSKVTIYRWWPSRAAVIMSAFLQLGRINAPYPQEMEPAGIVERLTMMAEAFCGPTGEMVKALLGEAQFDPEVAQAFRDGYILARRVEGEALITRAIEDGQIRAADPAVVLDLIYAPLWYRLLVGHGPLDAAFVRAHVDLVWNGLAAGRAGRAMS
jgi:AcrR family transcriptional regulator